MPEHTRRKRGQTGRRLSRLKQARHSRNVARKTFAPNSWKSGEANSAVLSSTNGWLKNSHRCRCSSLPFSTGEKLRQAACQIHSDQCPAVDEPTVNVGPDEKEDPAGEE